MANGALADRNRVPIASVAETGWSTTAPAANAKVLPLRLTARSVAAGTADAPVYYQGVFDARYPVSYAGLFATNFRQSNRLRLQLFADTGYTTCLFDTRDPVTGLDRRVMPALYDWRQLRWGAPNLFRGDLPPEDWALYPTNVHVSVPLVRARAFRWSLVGLGVDRATGADVNYHEVGLAWVSDSTYFSTQYSLGGSDIWTPTDEVSRTPGGGVFVEPGTGYRSVEIPRNRMTLAEGDSMFDLARRVNFSGPVVWLPDIDDATAMFRYGFVGQQRQPLRRTRAASLEVSTTLQIDEITL